MKNISQYHATVCGCLILGVVMWASVTQAQNPGGAATPKSNGWSFVVAPYGWFPSVEGTIGVDGHEADFDMPIQDSIDYLAGAGFLGLEARKGRWGVLFDGTYMELEDNATTPGPFFNNVDVTYQQASLDLGVAYRIIEGPKGWIDVLAGGRYMYYSTELGFSPNFEAADEISAEIVTRTASAVRDNVEGRVGGQADEIANKVSKQITATVDKLADAAKDQVLHGIDVRIDAGINSIVSEVGSRLSEGLDGRRTSLNNASAAERGRNATRRTLADAALGAFETRIDNKIQAGVDRIKIESEARRLASAIQSAVAEKVKQGVLNKGSVIEGDAAAIRQTVAAEIRKAAHTAIADLKKTVSADVGRALDRAEQNLSAKITDGMHKAEDADVSESIDWVDAYVGLRAKWLATEKVYVGLRGDVGGFGFGSSSDLVWELFGGVGYQFNKTVAMEVGWRYIDLDYDNGDFLMDVTYSGATAGLSFQL